MTDYYKNLDDPLLVARQIVSGEISPEQGCHILATICRKDDYPESLLTFEHLDHLRSGHEDLGFTEESITQDILEEAEKLIANSGS